MDDVEPALDHAPEVGHHLFGFLALGPHGPDLVEGPIVQPVEIVRGEEPFELLFE